MNNPWIKGKRGIKKFLLIQSTETEARPRRNRKHCLLQIQAMPFALLD